MLKVGAIGLLRNVSGLASLLTLSSCLAVAVLGDQVGHVRQPEVSRLRHVIRKNDETSPTVEESRVLDWWGKPDEESTSSDGTKTLTYYDGVRWNGILLFVLVLPVPLVLPVGHDYVEIDVVDGMVVAARTKCDDCLVEAYLGLPLHGMWCGVNRLPRQAVGEQFQRY